MKHAELIKELLRPLGVYRLEDGIGAGETESTGAALDGCAAFLEALQREMLLLTAEGEGLDRIEALLRVGGDSFTLAAINDNLKGCGLNAVASEGGKAGTVEVRFPEVPGIPLGFEEMKAIIEDILPCHLEVLYVFWYITWTMMEERFPTWGDVEAMGLTWEELEKLVK